MEYLEITVSIVALFIALWALNLQRKEIIKNGKINALIHTAALLQEKINYHSKIIDDLKEEKKDFAGHAHRINHELRPLQEKVNNEFLNISSKYDGILHEKEIRKSLKSTKI